MNNNICGIYKIENLINEKIYIGQSIDIKTRWKKHLNAKDDFIVHKALRKYGKENFSFEILEECKSQLLDEKEEYWVNYYNSLMPNGYNMVPAGSNGAGLAKGFMIKQFSLSGEFINSFSSANQASKSTGADGHQIIKCCKLEQIVSGGYQWRFNEDNTLCPNLLTEEYFHLKFSVVNRKICQYNKQGELINTFASLQEAANLTGISKSGICSCCRGKYYTSGGFKWGFEGEPLFKKNKKLGKNTKKIDQYDINENYIQTFDTITEAAKTLKSGGITGIANVLSGRAKTAGGYIWKYNKN